MPIEELDIGEVFAGEVKPEPKVAHWKQERCSRMCWGTCPLDALRQ